MHLYVYMTCLDIRHSLGLILYHTMNDPRFASWDTYREAPIPGWFASNRGADESFLDDAICLNDAPFDTATLVAARLTILGAFLLPSHNTNMLSQAIVQSTYLPFKYQQNVPPTTRRINNGHDPGVGPWLPVKTIRTNVADDMSYALCGLVASTDYKFAEWWTKAEGELHRARFGYSLSNNVPVESTSW
jgi:hypothetical protein